MLLIRPCHSIQGSSSQDSQRSSANVRANASCRPALSLCRIPVSLCWYSGGRACDPLPNKGAFSWARCARLLLLWISVFSQCESGQSQLTVAGAACADCHGCRQVFAPQANGYSWDCCAPGYTAARQHATARASPQTSQPDCLTSPRLSNTDLSTEPAGGMAGGSERQLSESKPHPVHCPGSARFPLGGNSGRARQRPGPSDVKPKSPGSRSIRRSIRPCRACQLKLSAERVASFATSAELGARGVGCEMPEVGSADPADPFTPVDQETCYGRRSRRVAANSSPEAAAVQSPSCARLAGRLAAELHSAGGSGIQ
jgi:hypothetical protein